MNSQRTQPASLGHLARLLKVSPSTVSRGLRGHASISEPTRRKIQELADSLGYRPQKNLEMYYKAIRREINGVVFLVAFNGGSRPFAEDPFYLRIQWAIQAALREEGLHMILADGSTDLLPDGKPMAIESGIANALIVQSKSDELISGVAKFAPTLVFDYEPKVGKVDAVAVDVHKAGRQQIDHLYQLGHRRIACFRPKRLGSPPSPQDQKFLREFVEYTEVRGIAGPPEWSVQQDCSPGDETSAVAEFAKYFETPNFPTAVLTLDLYAAQLIEMLKEKGLEVPRDVSIVGFDDDTHLRECPIALTTFRQSFEVMATEGIRMLRARMHHPESPGKVLKIEGELIVRDSSGPVRRKS